MTRQEAIEILKGDFSNIILKENESHSDAFTKAFNMAIEALEADVPDTNVGNMSERLTEYHQGVAVIKNKDFKAAAEKLAFFEDIEELGLMAMLTNGVKVKGGGSDE